MTGDEVFEVIDEIANSSSTLRKQGILEEFSSALLQKVLKLAYDPFIRFNLTYTETDYIDSDGTEELSDASIHCLSELQYIRGNAGLQIFERHLETLTPTSAELFVRILNKDLKAGINAKTINKVFPGLIRTMDYMRCSTQKEVPLETIDFSKGIYSQLKANGQFSRAVVDVMGNVKFYTRKGFDFPSDSFSEVSHELSRSRNSRFDGELLVVGPNGNLLSRKEGNGVLNSVRQGEYIPTNHKVIYVIWDVRIDNTDAIYSDRINRLFQLFGETVYVTVITTRLCYSFAEAVEMNKRLVNAGEEGTVLKRPLGLWRDGTSRDQIKFKNPFEVELLVVGYISGTGKNADTFGSLLCTTDDGILSVGVAGFSDAERKEEWLDAIITVLADEIITDKKTKEPTLLNPRFVERRLDKDKADTFEQVKAQYGKEY